VYGLSAVDARGRIADRAVMAALGWAPGRQLEVQAVRAVVTIRAAAGGTACVTSQGHLRLPAVVRHLCGLGPGDRVLLVADPHKRMVRVYPPATLDRLFAVQDADSAGGGSR
jgi:bifunctional DNA-binding transcriptional regulator/antitoxin component of YhaV-PrlF toxin-antitoxin module